MSKSQRFLTYRRQDALRLFKNISDSNLVLAVLARVGPVASWEGCSIGLMSGEERVCLVIEGKECEELQGRLKQALEQLSIPAMEAEESDCPGPLAPLVQVRAGQWEPATGGQA